jgi:hypothetical protein
MAGENDYRSGHFQTILGGFARKSAIAVFFYGAGISSKVSFLPESTVNADGFVFS